MKTTSWRHWKMTEDRQTYQWKGLLLKNCFSFYIGLSCMAVLPKYRQSGRGQRSQQQSREKCQAHILEAGESQGPEIQNLRTNSAQIPGWLTTFYPQGEAQGAWRKAGKPKLKEEAVVTQLSLEHHRCELHRPRSTQSYKINSCTVSICRWESVAIEGQHLIGRT